MKLLIDVERGFWTGDASYYREHLARACVMVFPGVGFMDRASSIRAIAEGPRWAEVRFEGARVVQLVDGAALLAYRVRARRPGDAEYRALAGSVYVREAGAWRLAFHHQSPE